MLLFISESTTLTPLGNEILKKNKSNFTNWDVRPVSRLRYGVKKGRKDVIVDFQERTCTCREVTT